MILRHVFALCMFITIIGCGGVSELTSHDEAEPELPTYETAVVLAFPDETTLEVSRLGQPLEKKHVQEACRQFADIIAEELVDNDVYETVLREPFEGDALRIEVQIDAYTNVPPKGLGAGFVNLESTINFYDNLTGNYVGEISVTEGSGRSIESQMWGLTPMDYYMRKAARKVVEEIWEARQAAAASNNTGIGQAINPD